MGVFCKDTDVDVVVIIVRVGVICNKVLGRGSVIARVGGRGCGKGNVIIVVAKSIAMIWMWMWW